MPERVVITGVGAVSPLGLTAEESWQNALKGVSGVGPITQFDASGFQVQIAAEVKNFKPDEYMHSREVRRRDRTEQLAAVAAQEAIRQAGLKANEENAGRIGVTVSSAIGGLSAFQEAVHVVRDEGPRRISPFSITMLMANGSSGLIAIDYGFKGPCFSIISACASGSDSIGTAWMLIRSGVIDAAVTGGTESTISPVGVAAFDRVGAMSHRNGLPPTTPQPFDRERDGLVMGEGAAVLVLESESYARQRGAEIIAELAGYAATADAYHITAPSEDGSGGSKAMRLAMAAAGVNLNDVDYISAHGTATPLNDLSETRAIKDAFGELAYNIPVSSTKSMTGHMMGATGALEAIFCAKAVGDNAIPPTINYHTPDPDCDLDYVPNQARQVSVKVALSNSFGFGGHNSVLVIKQYQ
jgi:3-oxoacyl-[acyl-carrier-protein] synthase II